MLDAILALEGYKSYSHEASIAYLTTIGINDSLTFKLDRFREKRNKSKYYGKMPSIDDAIEIKGFYSNNKQTFLNRINSKLK